MTLLVAALAAACGGSSSPQAPVPPSFIELAPRGDGWAANPVAAGLDSVSNLNGAYTGEIDVYEVTAPAPGSLVVSLFWQHDADFDLFVTADLEARVKLAEGILDDDEPEYVTVVVGGGQKVYVLVAGWEGDPGPYVLETILLPPGAETFGFVGGPDLDQDWPANRPMTFTFNKDLDPDQVAAERVFLVCQGLLGEGTWCVDGPVLTFYPRLPTLSLRAGLVAGESHTLQFPRAARGVRAATGEYLSGLAAAIFEVVGPEDAIPGAPPRVTAVVPSPTQPYAGGTITVALSEPLDPDTFFPELYQVAPDGSELPLAFSFALTQQYLCSGKLEVRLELAPAGTPPPGAVTRLRLPGTVLGLSGDPGPGNRLHGGAGFEVDFSTP